MGKPLSTVQVAEQQKQCYELRLSGHTIREIARALSIGVATVHKRIEDEISETVAPYREQYRAMELQRLDSMTRKIMELLGKQHFVISEGRVVRMDDAPLDDDEFVLKCIDRLTRISERRSKLEGWDAALRVDATVVETTQEDIALAAMVREAQAKAAADEARLTRDAVVTVRDE
jgi:hypothetical protein